MLHIFKSAVRSGVKFFSGREATALANGITIVGGAAGLGVLYKYLPEVPNSSSDNNTSNTDTSSKYNSSTGGSSVGNKQEPSLKNNIKATEFNKEPMSGKSIKSKAGLPPKKS